MKKIILFILIIATCPFAWAKFTYPMLVLDMRNAPQLPKNFRSTADSLPPGMNTNGLRELHMAGSAQFSKSALSAILSHLHTKNLLVVDLRQESHGMLNSNAISWYGKHNAENAGKSSIQIEEEQAALLKSLGEEQIAKVNNILKKSDAGEVIKVKPIEYLVHQTSTEENLVNEIHLRYKHFYVQDFHAPSDKEVDQFVEMVRSLPTNKWIYFHCRGGVGRTTVFMTMNDILHNAKKISLEDILARQTALGGKDLTVLPEKNNFKYKWSQERFDFIKKFYDYARDNRNHLSWSEWKAARAG